ncbi:aminotransferase class I/II-fold pyridoxal phosphate-dependent enzyme [Azospirillum brasilense]|nr:aminotransferase class I/II-fold pyridoxal phosphate-dependent enzyme [Azospirillum brasilense]
MGRTMALNSRDRRSGVDARALATLKATMAELDRDSPIYVRIATALPAQVASGQLSPGQALPSHRELARSLDVNLTTITKAFNLLKKRGVISAEAGRGTAVRGRDLNHAAPSYDQPRLPPAIDLSVHKLSVPGYQDFIGSLLRQIASRPDDLARLQEYHSAFGSNHNRRLAVEWLLSWGVSATPNQVAVTAGAQHAILVVLASVLTAGDSILVPRLVYQGVKAAAQVLGLGLIPVDTDEHGMIPDSLARLVGDPRVKAIFLVPTLANPTTVTMPLDRRQAIVDIARRNSLLIVEDDLFRPLASNQLPSLWSLYPEGCFHISSLSKVIAPGNRCGFLAFPERYGPAIASALRGSIWMTDVISLTLVQSLLEQKKHLEFVGTLRQQLTTRHSLALTHFGNALAKSDPESLFLWLDLDSGQDSTAIAEMLYERGIGVVSSDVFMIGKTKPNNGIRIYKGSARSDTEWDIALSLIATLVRKPE